jgi:glutamate-5-semialdehyde dehydrogenase
MDCTLIFKNAQKASHELNDMDVSTINQVLLLLADDSEANISFIIRENKKDLALIEKTDPRYDRLQLTTDRIRSITSDLRNVAALPSPVDNNPGARSLWGHRYYL